MSDEINNLLDKFTKLIDSEIQPEEIDDFYLARMTTVLSKKKNLIEFDFSPRTTKFKIPMYHIAIRMTEKSQIEILHLCNNNDFLYRMLEDAIEKKYSDLFEKILKKGVIFDDRNSYFKLLTMIRRNEKLRRILKRYRQSKRENFLQRYQINFLEKLFDSLDNNCSFVDYENIGEIEDDKFYIEPKSINKPKKKFYQFDMNIFYHIHSILPRYDSTIINFTEHREKSDIIIGVIDYLKKLEERYPNE